MFYQQIKGIFRCRDGLLTLTFLIPRLVSNIHGTEKNRLRFKKQRYFHKIEVKEIKGRIKIRKKMIVKKYTEGLKLSLSVQSFKLTLILVFRVEYKGRNKRLIVFFP